jgi:hypothetical protein
MRPSPSIEIAALQRGDRPAERAATAVRRLIGVVAEWRPDAGLDVTIGSTGPAGRVHVRLDSFGPTAPDWQADAAWAMQHTARVRVARSGLGDDVVTEVVVMRADREFQLPAVDEDAVTDWADQVARRRYARGESSWPSARFNDLRGVLELLAERPELAVRFRMAACTPLEATMMGEALRSTWTGDEQEVPDYLGRPIRLRAMLASRSGGVPPRLRALSRQWASNLRLVPLDGVNAQEMWNGDPLRLAGTMVPEGLAMGLVRLPVAGRSPVAGMRSESAALHGRPLDPVPPKPASPIRLGRAIRVDRRHTDASIAPSDGVRHMSIDGSSGSGKTTLLRAIMHEFGKNPQVSFTFLEPHGEGARQVAEEVQEAARDRTVLIQHGRDDARFGLNILDHPPGDELTTMIDAFADLIADKDDPRNEGYVGPRWRRSLGITAESCVAAFGPEASLVTVAAVLSDMERVRLLARRIRPSHPELSHRLMNELGRLEGKESVDLTSWAVSKFHPLVSGSRMRGIIGSRSSVDVARAMDEGTNLIIDLDMPSLGVPAAKMLGALWILEHWMAMGRRADPTRPHYIVCDEAHLFQYGALPSLLAEGRKFGLGVIVATQDVSRLRGSLADGLEANAGSYISLRAGAKAAIRSSVRLGDWPVEELTRLPDLRAAAVLSRDGVQTEPFTLEVDHNRRLAKAGLTPAARAESLAALADRAKRDFSDPHDGDELLSDERLMEILAGRAEPSRRSVDEPAAEEAAAQVPSGRTHHLDEQGSFLDDWLARHTDVRQSGTKSPTKSPTKGTKP